MIKVKNINGDNKKNDNLQDQFADERLSEEELDGAAGGNLVEVNPEKFRNAQTGGK